MFQKRLKKNLTDKDIDHILFRLIMQTILAMIIFFIIQFFMHEDCVDYAFRTPHRKNTYPGIAIMIEYVPFAYHIDPEKWTCVEKDPGFFGLPNIISTVSDPERRLLYYPIIGGMSFSNRKNIYYNLTPSGGLSDYIDSSRETFATEKQRRFFEKDMEDFLGPVLEYYRNSKDGSTYGQFLFDLKFYDRFH